MEKEKFLNYCKMFGGELADLHFELEYEDDMENGTLADIGIQYSYELANIGFELGYAGWHFKAKGSFEEIKDNFVETIMYNEKLEDFRTIEELKEIENRLLKAKNNLNGDD